MAIKIGVVSQKGGVGKSTLARMIACEYAEAGWEVKIADMDLKQSTSYDWQQDRLAKGTEPTSQSSSSQAFRGHSEPKISMTFSFLTAHRTQQSERLRSPRSVIWSLSQRGSPVMTWCRPSNLLTSLLEKGSP